MLLCVITNECLSVFEVVDVSMGTSHAHKHVHVYSAGQLICPYMGVYLQ